MSAGTKIKNRLKQFRLERKWSQEDVARLSGVSRAAVSAIETGRIVPSVAVALELSTLFGCQVEDLFGHSPFPDAQGVRWSSGVRPNPCRFWRTRVGDDFICYPVEETHVGMILHDGVETSGEITIRGDAEAERTIIIAGCDPAVTLLNARITKGGLFRVVPLMRSSTEALEMLGAGLVHFAGLHLGAAYGAGGNAAAVREKLGPGYRLIRIAAWEEGVAFSPDLGLPSLRDIVRAKIAWVGREPGSGANQCLEWLASGLSSRPLAIRQVAHSHRAVAAAIRDGSAQAGVCVRIVAEEARLDFRSARTEDYDLCYRSELEDDARVAAVLEVIRSKSFRTAMAELPGYQLRHTGELQEVKRGTRRRVAGDAQ